ncbi:MAG TPA: tetratricopeptide repeat protein [Chthoniobacterales bacterium]|nr:tetratricopeptide repeat protein [Chthoniobacterales bacterium]
MKGEQRLWSILNDKLDTLRASNRLPEAIRVAESALDLAKRAFSEEDGALAISYEKLGQLLEQQGDRAASKAYLLKAHAILENGKPVDERALFSSARRLAFLCDNLGQSEEAIRFYEKAIAAGSKLDDLPYSDLGTMLNNVALIFRKSGRQKAAEPYYLHALQIYEKQLGPEHPDVASVLNNLAVFYTNERRYAEAEKIHRRALAIREKVHPPTHPDIAQSKCNLAVVYHSRGDYGRAAELYRASLEAWEQTVETPPEDYEIVASNYADLLRSLGKVRKAQQLEARVRKRRRAS